MYRNLKRTTSHTFFVYLLRKDSFVPWPRVVGLYFAVWREFRRSLRHTLAVALVKRSECFNPLIKLDSDFWAPRTSGLVGIGGPVPREENLAGPSLGFDGPWATKFSIFAWLATDQSTELNYFAFDDLANFSSEIVLPLFLRRLIIKLMRLR